jgi:hypothetical protein
MTTSLRSRLAAVVAITLAATLGALVPAAPAFALSGPAITTQPQGITVVAGEFFNLTIGVTGDPTPAVQWQVFGNFGNGNIWNDSNTGTTFTSSFEVTSQVRAVVSNSEGTVTSDVVTITVIADTRPTITRQPAAVAARVGDTVTFTAAADGTPPPAVKWQKQDSLTNWNDVPGATGTTLTLSNVALADSGSVYRAWFSNGGGALATNGATLTVTPRDAAPQVTENPQSQAIYYDDDVTLFAAATGYPAPTVQWQQSSDGTSWADIPGERSDSLYLPRVQAVVFLRAVFTNSVSSATSAPAQLDFNGPSAPVIVSQPSDEYVMTGAPVGFDVRVVGLPAASFQWYIQHPGGSWERIDGATSHTVVLPVVTTADDGAQLRVDVTNSVGTTVSDPALLTVYDLPPTISMQPIDSYPTSGSAGAWVTTFTASAAGDPDPTITWERQDGGGGWTTIDGQTGGSVTITAPAGTEVRATFENNSGSAVSDAASVLDPSAPVLTWVSHPSTVSSGQAADFSVSAVGSPTPAVSWQKLEGSTWVDIAGATGTDFSTGALAFADSGLTVRAVATNVAGTVETTSATVAVLAEAPAVVTQPTDVSVVSGDNAVFTIRVSGDPAPHIQWQTAAAGTSDWVDFPGATGSTFTIPAVRTTEDGLQVRAVITGQDASTSQSRFAIHTDSVVQLTSNSVTLSVAALAPQIINQPNDVTVPAGTAATFAVTAVGDPQVSYQWQVKGSDGVWHDVPGATGASYTSAQLGNGDGVDVRVVVTNSAGSATSLAATARGVVGLPFTGLDPSAPLLLAVILILLGAFVYGRRRLSKPFAARR